MPLFRYTSHDEQGEAAQGMIDALNIQAARAALRQMNVQIDSIEEVDPIKKEEPVAWQVTEHETTATPVVLETSTAKRTGGLYYPIIDTLRLYAGWLLAWYFLIYALGSYQFLRKFPFQLPYIDDLFWSPIVLSFTFGAFLFLLLSSVHRLFGRGLLTGAGLTVLGLVALFLFHQNI